MSMGDGFIPLSLARPKILDKAAAPGYRGSPWCHGIPVRAQLLIFLEVTV